mgnify:CR=1 FL=1
MTDEELNILGHTFMNDTKFKEESIINTIDLVRKYESNGKSYSVFYDTIDKKWIGTFMAPWDYFMGKHGIDIYKVDFKEEFNKYGT